MRLLLDTHAWAWSLSNNTTRLSAKALSLISSAEAVFVSPITIFEIGQKVRLGKWPDMAPYLHTLPELVAEQGAQFAQLTPAVCLGAVTLDWDHRDPFDRLLAATAIENTLPLISADPAFDRLLGMERWTARLW